MPTWSYEGDMSTSDEEQAAEGCRGAIQPAVIRKWLVNPNCDLPRVALTEEEVVVVGRLVAGRRRRSCLAVGGGHAVVL